MEDVAAAEADSFIIEVEDFVGLSVDVEGGVEVEVDLGIVVLGSITVVLVTGLVLVVVLVTGGMLEVVIGTVKAINSGLKIPIPDPVLRQFASRVSQTGPRKAEPQRVLVHIATAFKKVTLEHKQAFDITGVVVVASGQPDVMASANKHG